MSASEMPNQRSSWRRRIRYWAASSAERRSGAVTISTSGTPQRLKSIKRRLIGCLGFPGIFFHVQLPDPHMAHVGLLSAGPDGQIEIAAFGQRHIELRDLVTLGQVRVEIILAVKK